MNCFNHPMDSAVAVCQDCSKGLCTDCASKYEIPICTECNQKRISAERSDIIKEFLITFLVGGVIAYFMLSHKSSEVLTLGDKISLFYISCGLVSGWRTLNSITPRVFLIMPIIGWVFYFIFKFMIAIFIGPFVLPFRFYRRIKGWIELNNIPL